MKHLIILLLFPFLAAAQPIISCTDVIKPYGDFQSPLAFEETVAALQKTLNPKVGTALMQENPRLAIELPLKILIYEDGKKVNIRYEKIAAIAEKYHLKQTFSTAEKIDAAMQQLIKLAIGEYRRGTPD